MQPSEGLFNTIYVFIYGDGDHQESMSITTSPAAFLGSHRIEQRSKTGFWLLLALGFCIATLSCEGYDTENTQYFSPSPVTHQDVH